MFSHHQSLLDIPYKIFVLNFLGSGEVGALLPVVAMLLQFSPEEVSYLFFLSLRLLYSQLK